MDSFNVTVKCKENKGAIIVLSGIFLTFGIVFAWMSMYLLLSASHAERIVSIFMALLAAFFLMMGGTGMMSVMRSVHLVPQGIAVTLWGKTLVRYPIESIGMFFAVQWWQKGWVRILGISVHTPDKLTQMREDQLRKGIFTRDELKFRKRVPNWQSIFRQEYLLKRAKLAWLMPWKRDILWLGLVPETVELLRHYYPNTPWEFLRDQGDVLETIPSWKDREPTKFSRARNAAPKAEKATIAGFVIFMVPIVLLMILVDGTQMLGLLVVELGVIIGFLAYLGKGESDEIQLSPTGIRIMRGKREHAVMPADEIRTIIKCEGDAAIGSFGGFSLIVSAADVKELIRRADTAEHNKGYTHEKEIPGWEQRALFRFCTQLRGRTRDNNRDCQRMSWNPQREQTLRELYPKAQWIDVTPDVIYEASPER